MKEFNEIASMVYGIIGVVLFFMFAFLCNNISRIARFTYLLNERDKIRFNEQFPDYDDKIKDQQNISDKKK